MRTGSGSKYECNNLHSGLILQNRFKYINSVLKGTVYSAKDGAILKTCVFSEDLFLSSRTLYRHHMLIKLQVFDISKPSICKVGI